MTTVNNNRVVSIDLLKGLVMVIMALDHVRDYFHYSANFFDPTDPTQTTFPIYFTRWITHFCAPTFCFLAGISAFLVGKRKTPKQLSVFLATRGLWLVLIELTVVNFGWFFDPEFRTFGLLVIWSLGICMIALSVLIYLPPKVLLLFCGVLIFGHNLLDSVDLDNNVLWNILHQPTLINVTPHTQLFIGYPVIPWIAVMALGYYFGQYYDQSFDSSKREKLFNAIGFVSIILFLILRGTNFYGNPTPWLDYEGFTKDLYSFLNPNKYPPSLLYLLMTLGVAFLFLANSENLKGRVVNFFCTFGRVPFFYYILHLYAIHITAMIFAEISGLGWEHFILPTWIGFIPEIKGYGYNLITVYLVWLGIVAVLYPICKKFDAYKQNHKQKTWLSYL